MGVRAVFGYKKVAPIEYNTNRHPHDFEEKSCLGVLCLEVNT
jgi:hypothetical protein